MPRCATGQFWKNHLSVMAANWWAYEFWRFVFAQKEVGTYAQAFVDFPPMQKNASFNLQALEESSKRR